MDAEVPQTERLRFRPLRTADEDALFAVFADAYARQFYPQMTAQAEVRAWIEWNLRNYALYGFGLWALEPKPQGQLIGACGLTFQDVEGRSELEIGFHVLECERGLPHRRGPHPHGRAGNSPEAGGRRCSSTRGATIGTQ